MVRIPSSTSATATLATTMEEDPVQAQDEPQTNERVGTPVATKEPAAPTVTRPDDTTGDPPTPDGTSEEQAVVDVPDGRAGEERPASTPPPTEPPAALPSSAREPDDRRPFKVVLTCKPAAEGSWHATIAIGQDGCDPAFEASDVAHWPEALDVVSGAVAAAQARWAEQPLNPMAPAASGRPRLAAGNTQAKGRTGDDAGPGKAGTPTPAGQGASPSGEGVKPAAGGGRGAATPATASDRNAARLSSGTPAERKAARSKAQPRQPAAPAQTELTGGVEKLTLF